MAGKMKGCGGALCQALGQRLGRCTLIHSPAGGSSAKSSQLCGAIVPEKRKERRAALRIEGRGGAGCVCMLVAAMQAEEPLAGDIIKKGAQSWRVISVERGEQLRLVLLEE